MVKIAQVIVDVPTMQTNKPYDYAVPEAMTAVLREGQRVVVPFGQGTRLVQGFIVGIKSHTEFSGELKSIEKIVDLSPVLNDEMLALGKELSNQTYSFLITCYQTMLPSALRAKYDKVIQKTAELSKQDEVELFEGQDEISWEEAEERDILARLMALKIAKKVKVHYIVTDRRTYKTERHLQTLLNFEEIEEALEGLAKNATKQRLLLETLQKEGDKELLVKTLREKHGINYSTLQTAEEKGWIRQFEVEVYRDPYGDRDIERTTPLTLTDSQQPVYEKISDSVNKNNSDVFLLKGITGSGKTEIYMQVIADALQNNQTAVMLVPEIALTPQMVHRFKGRFGDLVAVMHSGLSDGERYDEWRRIEENEAKIVVGARSSIFAPLENIGVIVIDEEHEHSYKQQENPRYHARNVAKWRGEYHNCPVILGSATPSLESRARASKNVYELLEMNERPTSQPLPGVQIINLQNEAKAGNRGTFSELLLNQIKDRIQKGEQSVLMLNRRGYSSFVMCRDCGFVLPCPNCDISLTLHMDTKTMNCHYCGHEEQIPQTCSQCHSRSMRYYGTGTQKVEEELQELLPEARILRMDRDTTRKKGAHERLLNTFGEGKADVLLGTQMIAKGLDFPNVTLVGVLNADTSLHLPDFRSSEKTFQLLTQVSGRAGRGEKAGEVYIQTYNPDHYAIQLAKYHDYDQFYLHEMTFRHKGNYPPYFYTLRLSVSHQEERMAAKVIYQMADFLKPYLPKDAIMLGPTPKAIARLQNRYHYQIIVKYKNKGRLHEKLHELLQNNQHIFTQGVAIAIDPEPVSFM